jgi:rhamnosyltransferase
MMRVIEEAITSFDCVEAADFQYTKSFVMDDVPRKEVVCVFMSTYNGEKYLRRQLDTILCQVGVRIELHIRDDGSTDKTREILNDYAMSYSNIRLYLGENLGHSQSFYWLVSNTTTAASYFAFADQDDVWDTNKIEIAVQYIKEEEAKCPAAPILYACTSRLVDSNEKYIGQTIGIKKGAGKYSLIARRANAHSMLYNANLNNLMKRFHPIEFIHVDARALCLASYLGEIIYDNCPHQMWRRHRTSITSTSKASKLGEHTLVKGLRVFLKRASKPLKNIDENMAQEVLNAFSAELRDSDRAGLLLVATYRESLTNRFQLLNDKSFFDGVSLYHRIYFKALVLLGAF